MTRAAPVRVWLVDDHNLVRAGVRKILETQRGIQVVGESSDGGEALRALDRETVDLLVLDLSMPDMDGFAVLTSAKQAHPELKVLVLTMHANSEYIARALRQGADGYLLKDSAVQELVAAIAAVTAGRAYYSPAVQSGIGAAMRAEAEPALEHPLDRLTERERQVLRLVARGLSTKEIAANLGISPRTVDAHRANLMRKVDLHSVARLTQLALREGILDDP
jgi:RNA polymerase sigma factor (sigma-70 family)